MFAGHVVLHDEIGPGRAGRRPVEQEFEQCGGVAERRACRHPVGLLGQAQAAEIGADHPHPSGHACDRSSLVETVGPNRIALDGPDPGAGGGERDRERTPACADVDDQVALVDGQPGYEAVDQVLVSEEVLAVGAPSLIPGAPTPAPGHGAAPS